MNEAELQLVLEHSAQTAIALQRKILAAGDAIDDGWKRLGWETVDSTLDALIERLPVEPRRRPAF